MKQKNRVLEIKDKQILYICGYHYIILNGLYWCIWIFCLILEIRCIYYNFSSLNYFYVCWCGLTEQVVIPMKCFASTTFGYQASSQSTRQEIIHLLLLCLLCRHLCLTRRAINIYFDIYNSTPMVRLHKKLFKCTIHLPIPGIQ